MGGGGGDGGASARQAEAERKKQAARNSLNSMFGVAPDAASLASAAPAPAASFVRQDMPIFGAGMDAARERNDWLAANPAPAPAPADPVTASPLVDEAAKNKAARDALYGTVRDNAFTAGRRSIDEGAADAARKLKFALAASGLSGGSVAIDEGALLKRTTDRGLLDLGAKADAAKADLMGSDEQTRLGLLQAIDAGTDQGSALSSALNQMKVNADKAAAAAQGTNVGDLFSTGAMLYDRRLRNLGTAAATRDYTNAGGRSGAYLGTISGTGV